MQHTRYTNLTARVGRWSAQHRRWAVFGWLAIVAAAFVLANHVGTRQLTDAETMTGESTTAQRILDQNGMRPLARETVLVQSQRLATTDPQVRAAIHDVVAAVTAVNFVDNVHSPLDQTGHGLVSRDGHSALVQFDVAGDANTAKKRIEPVLAAVHGAQQRHPDLRIEEYGPASMGKALDDTVMKDFHRAELFSVPLTLIILVVAFGAVLAAVLPVVLALTAFVGALGLVALTSHVVPIDQSTLSVMLLIGMAVGVDYTLFYVRREREERAAGRSAEAALEAAAATSGHSVLISGVTVMVAVAGMFLAGSGVFRGIAVGTILVVATTVVGSLTVLPALLSKLGDRIESGRVPLLHRMRAGASESRIWAAVLRPVLRRPLVSALLAGAALLALALPAVRMHIVQPGSDDFPARMPIIQTYQRIQTAFPGGPIPAQVVVKANDVTRPDVAQAIRALRVDALATGQMHDPIQVQTNPARTVAVVSIPLAGDGQDQASNQALATLRGQVIPSTIGRVSGVQVAVGGQTANAHDFNDRMRQRAPLVFGFVLGLAFLLLLITFRSVVIPLKAIVLNLLSVGAAYGVLVAVFQWGWGQSLLGFTSTGGITSWLPLFLFVILFGLSMDYHVFILSRAREAYDRGMSTPDAVAHGIRTSAGVVTSAAVVMVGVFSLFATLSQVSMKQVGIGLAAAVLIDATIVRAVLLPATMKLLGDLNWYLPKWLTWLPRVTAGETAPDPDTEQEEFPALAEAA